MFNSINFLHHYDSLKAKSLKCRVLPNSDIEPLLDSLSGLFKVSILGVSETDIMELNDITSGRSLKAGQMIKIKTIS